MRRVPPFSLTGRLVVTVVALVAVVGALTATLALVAMRGTLRHQLDEQIARTSRQATGEWQRALGVSVPGPPGAGDGDHHDADFGAGQSTGTLSALYGPYGLGGSVLTAPRGSNPRPRSLTKAQLTVLRGVPVDGSAHQVSLDGLGTYRVVAARSAVGTVVAGLPTSSIDHAVSELMVVEGLLLVLGVAVAAGAGTVLVRRQLEPLRRVAATAHEVSELPLSSGEIEMSARVPDELTDPRSEVGQVGSAMNTMLVHVEEALDARHRSEQQVRQFVADASHELRTPLATIHGYAELSRRRSPAEPELLTSAMAKVESEATRMSSLVDDLLLLARLDAGRPLQRRDVDLTRLAIEALSDAKVVAPDHHWRLDLPEEPVVTTGDEMRLHQVVTNLLNNARRHTPPGTTVTVSVAEERAGAVVSVHDDGPGLPPELVPRAFERFTRGDSSRTRASGGAGLGLSLVQAIVTAHSGTVDLASVPGSTTFRLHLPGLRSQAADRTDTQPANL